MEIDLNQSGLALIFKDYQEEAMKLIWGDVKYLGSKKENGNKEFSSREVWDHLNRTVTTIPASRDSISRASVINFLNAMCDEGVLGFHEITGKGGHRRIYQAHLSKTQFWGRVTILTIKKLEEASGLSETVLTSVIVEPPMR